jgi:hypothetical protein
VRSSSSCGLGELDPELRGLPAGAVERLLCDDELVVVLLRLGRAASSSFAGRTALGELGRELLHGALVVGEPSGELIAFALELHDTLLEPLRARARLAQLHDEASFLARAPAS